MSILQVLCWHQYVVKNLYTGANVTTVSEWSNWLHEPLCLRILPRFEKIDENQLSPQIQRIQAVRDGPVTFGDVRERHWYFHYFYFYFLTNWSTSGHPLRPKSSKMPPCCDTSTRTILVPFPKVQLKFHWRRQLNEAAESAKRDRDREREPVDKAGVMFLGATPLLMHCWSCLYGRGIIDGAEAEDKQEKQEFLAGAVQEAVQKELRPLIACDSGNDWRRDTISMLAALCTACPVFPRKRLRWGSSEGLSSTTWLTWWSGEL